PHALDARTYAEKKLPDLGPEHAKADHVSFGAPSRDGRYALIYVASARQPTTSLVLDWQTQKPTAWVSPSTPEIDTTKFAAPTLESYPARDGTKIPMFVRRPEACVKPAEPCPVVVHFHGGPESQSIPAMSVYGQSFVDAGFIWIDPNVRGSNGYGKTWLKAD